MKTLAPIARPHDPETSWEAAELQTESRREIIKAAIVTVLKNHGPCSDETIADHYEGMRFMSVSLPNVTPQNLRTRRHELVTEDKIRASETRGRTRTGNTCQLWVIA